MHACTVSINREEIKKIYIAIKVIEPRHFELNKKGIKNKN